MEFLLGANYRDNLYVGVEKNAQVLENLANLGGSLVLRGEQFNLYIGNAELAALDIGNAEVVTVLLEPVDVTAGSSITAAMLGEFKFVTIQIDGEYLDTPTFTMTKNIAGAGLSVEGEIRLVAFVFDEETQTYVLLPAMVDNGVITFQFSGSGVVGIKSYSLPYVFLRFEMHNNLFTHGYDRLTGDAAPFIANNRALVPLRVIAEALGGVPHWDGPNQTAYIFFGYMTLRLPMGQELPGGLGTPAMVPTIGGSRVLVPTRFVSESMGARVRWDGANQAVYVYRR